MPTQKIVVIGSSYSAAAVFNYLERSLTTLREPFDLLLLSDKNHYVHDDLLSQYLCASCNLEDTCQWLRGITFLRPGISYLETEVLNIDFQTKTISTLKGDVNYQYLILAPQNDLFDESNIDKTNNAFVIKNLSDILKLKTHILSKIEESVIENDPEIKNSLLAFSVIGTNKDGIQLACSISDFVNRLLKNHFPEIKKSFLKINLIEKDNAVALNKDPFYNNRIFYNLNKKGITLYTNSQVTKIKNNKIVLNNKDEILSETVVFTTLNASSSLMNKLKTLYKSCNVDLYMKLEGFDDVFMVGEVSNCLDLEEGFEKTNFFDKNQAKICADNVCAKINNTPMKLLKPNFQMNFLSLGYRNSLVEFKNIHLDGIIGWFLHRISFIFCSLSWKKKLRTFVGLICNIFGFSEFEQMNIYELKSTKQALKK